MRRRIEHAVVGRATAMMRARLTLPTLTLSLSKTFPRIIRGYQLTNAAAVARADGSRDLCPHQRAIDGRFCPGIESGGSDCLVHEPEGRLLAVVYFSPSGREPLPELGDGCRLLNPALERARLAAPSDLDIA